MTAYEMRMSDWSSDVCSSDLLSVDLRWLRRADPVVRTRPPHLFTRQFVADREIARLHRGPGLSEAIFRACCRAGKEREKAYKLCWQDDPSGCRRTRRRSPPRSEEHTSDLQSLMRISYADFFLKKKK